MWLCGRLITPSRNLCTLRRIIHPACRALTRLVGGAPVEDRGLPAECPATFRRQTRECSASFPPAQIPLNLHHLSSTLIVFFHSSCTDQLPNVSTNSSTHMDPQQSTAWSPPWRKACVPCTRAKRRCDKRLPACQRCVERGVSCQYPSGRPYARRAVRTPRTAESPEPSPLNSLHHPRGQKRQSLQEILKLPTIHGKMALMGSSPHWTLAVP